jgi:hypothetical protein
VYERGLRSVAVARVSRWPADSHGRLLTSGSGRPQRSRGRRLPIRYRRGARSPSPDVSTVITIRNTAAPTASSIAAPIAPSTQKSTAERRRRVAQRYRFGPKNATTPSSTVFWSFHELFWNPRSNTGGLSRTPARQSSPQSPVSPEHPHISFGCSARPFGCGFVGSIRGARSSVPRRDSSRRDVVGTCADAARGSPRRVAGK